MTWLNLRLNIKNIRRLMRSQEVLCFFRKDRWMVFVVRIKTFLKVFVLDPKTKDASTKMKSYFQVQNLYGTQASLTQKIKVRFQKDPSQVVTSSVHQFLYVHIVPHSTHVRRTSLLIIFTSKLGNALITIDFLFTGKR